MFFFKRKKQDDEPVDLEARSPQLGIKNKDLQLRAETLEGTDLDAAWARLEREAPEYPNYKTKTDREIAIVRLRRR